jgi:hypothetical protein
VAVLTLETPINPCSTLAEQPHVLPVTRSKRYEPPAAAAADRFATRLHAEANARSAPPPYVARVDPMTNLPGTIAATAGSNKTTMPGSVSSPSFLGCRAVIISAIVVPSLGMLEPTGCFEAVEHRAFSRAAPARTGGNHLGEGALHVL